MARSTIKMWGPHLKSADTRRKLQKYDQLRNDPRLRNTIHDRTITFGPPPSMNTPFVVPKKRSSNDRRLLKGDRTWSQQRKANHYRDIFDGELESKYDYIPYVDILTLPSKDRPHNFAQCIDFFYPASGVTSHISTTYPFTTTFPQAYEYKHESSGGDYNHYRGANVKTNKMPVDLGEITMTYIWFIMYKLLLAENVSQILPEPEHFLKQSSDKHYENMSLLSEIAQRQVAERTENLISKLGVASQLVDVAGGIATSYANGAFDNVNSVEDGAKALAKILDEEGNYLKEISAFIKGEVADLIETMGLKSNLAKPIAGFIVGSAMNPKVYQKLNDTDRQNLHVIARDRLIAEFDDYKDLLNTEDAKKILAAYITKDYTQTVVSSPQAKTFLNKLKSTPDRHFSELYTKAIKQLKARNNGVRENGVLATIGISLVTTAAGATIKSMGERAAKRARGYNDWFKVNKFAVNPAFTEEGFELAFDDFTTDGRMASGDNWFATAKMYCSPRNGLQEAEFAKALYTIFRPIASYLRGDLDPLSIKSLLGDKNKLFEILSRNGIGYNKNTGKLTTGQFQRWFTSYNSCQTYKIFLENALESTRIVFQDIESFSPFTQAYGLEPLFLEGNASNRFARNAQLAIIGDPKAAGKEYTTPDSPSGAFIVPGQSTYGAVSKNASIKRGRRTATLNRSNNRFACPPGSYYFSKHRGSCNFFRNTGSNEQGWTTPEVEKYYADLYARKNRGVTLVGAARNRNSQRRLSDEVPFGHYGSTSLGFDVAYGIPIFNAQWPALVSVLSVYPQAIEEMDAAGYQWAKRIYPTYKRNNPKMVEVSDRLRKFLRNIPSNNLSTTSRIAQIMGANKYLPFIGAGKNFIDPQVALRLAQGSSQVTSGESQTTSEDEESMTGLYVALGLGITAIAGASYYVIQKKKGKF